MSSGDNDGSTALHHASRNVTGLRLLLADPRLTTYINARGGIGHTPLMRAMWLGCVECVRELVRLKGVDLETRDDGGRSLEQVAMTTNNYWYLSTGEKNEVMHGRKTMLNRCAKCT